MAKSNGLYTAVLIARPGCHCVGIGIIQHNGSRLRYFPDVFAELQHLGDHSLSVHNPACAERIAYALVYPVLQWNLNIRLESFQTADPHTVDNVLRIPKRLSSVCGGVNFYRNTVSIQVPLA